MTPAARKLFILGEGPDRLRLERIVSILPLKEKSVGFYGRVDESKKLKLLHDSDVLVFIA